MGQASPSDQIQKWVVAAQAKNAGDMGKLYTTDAVLCATEGIFVGPKAIQADFDTQLNKNGWVLIGVSNETDNVSTDWGWSYGEWSGTFPDPNDPTKQIAVNGFWSVVWVLDNGNWMMKQQSIITVPP